MFLKPYTLRNILRKFNFKSRSQPAMVIVKHMWGLRSAIMFRSQASKLLHLSLGCGRNTASNIVNKWLEHAAVTASISWWNDCQACYQPVTALPVVSHHNNIFIFLQILLRLRERSMLEEELFSLFKGHTKLLRSAAAGVARVGRVGWWGLYSYHRYIHLVPATTTTTTTLLQLRGLSTR